MPGVISRKRWIAAASAVIMAFAWQTCRADSGDAPLIAWSCWLGRDALYSIHCLNVGEPIMIEAATPARNEAADPGRFRQDLFAAGASPNLARLVRADPAAYDEQLWLIPLYGPPLEMERVRLLARSVMCGRDPRCTVRFGDIPTAPFGMGMYLR